MRLRYHVWHMHARARGVAPRNLAVVQSPDARSSQGPVLTSKCITAFPSRPGQHAPILLGTRKLLAVHARSELSLVESSGGGTGLSTRQETSGSQAKKDSAFLNQPKMGLVHNHHLAITYHVVRTGNTSRACTHSQGSSIHVQAYRTAPRSTSAPSAPAALVFATMEPAVRG